VPGPLRVFVDATDPDLVRRVRDDVSRAGWTIVTRADDADVVVRPARPRAETRPATPSTSITAWDEGDDMALHESLTPRELDVLRLLAEGAGNRAIGERLGISDHTVKFHLSAIFGKLGVGTRTAAVRRALGLGWIDV
jgi:ATP/maltotriose-dependent transcriptional regulator MalT